MKNKMIGDEHTPTPWHYAPGEFVYGPHGESVASCRFITNFPDVNRANMRLIVLAVNAHEQLVEAAKQVLDTLKRCGYGGSNRSIENADIRLLEKAIAKAEPNFIKRRNETI